MCARSFICRVVVWSMLSVCLAGGSTNANESPKGKRAIGARGKLRLPLIQRDVSVAKKSSNKMKPLEKAACQTEYELCLSSNYFKNDNTLDQHGTPALFELLCYNKLAVGPVLRMCRGTTVKVHLTNLLNGQKDPGFNPDLPPNSLLTAETPHGLCTTNLHTHGLHISPGGKSDNIFRSIEPIDPASPPTKDNPYNEFTFEYVIPADHPSGTFWYHPHKHGSVAYQLSNGLAGALIIEGSDDDTIADLDDIPEIKNAHEEILVIQLYNYADAVANSGPYKGQHVAVIDAGTVYNVAPACRTCLDVQFAIPPDPGQARAVNGMIVPEIHIAPGEVQRWRIIHGSWDALAPLIWVDADDKPTDSLVFWEIAVDGLATGSMARKTRIDLAPGQRSDVLIKAPNVPDGTIFFLKADYVPGPDAPNTIEQDQAILAKIVVTGKPPKDSTKLPDLSNPKVADQFARCRPFKAIGDEELADTPAVGPGLVFSADDNPPDSMPHYYTISRRTFHDSPPLVVELGTAEEWTISAEAGNHPFHIHVNPFQVVGYVDANGHSQSMDVWRDTLYVRSGESYTIRSRFQHFAGDSVLHCHILDHEDQGMMRCVRFIDPNDPNPQPQDPGCPYMPPTQPALKPCDVAAGKVPLSGNDDGLKTLLGKNVILVFFRGLECAHCTRALKALVRDFCDQAVVDAEIVAVSAEPIGDLERAIKELNPDQASRFHLVADTSHNAFRAFSCWQRDHALHGLFVIDSAGRVRARYVGQAPFDDTSAIARCIAQLSTSRP